MNVDRNNIYVSAWDLCPICGKDPNFRGIVNDKREFSCLCTRSFCGCKDCLDGDVSKSGLMYDWEEDVKDKIEEWKNKGFE